ncbi:MAG: aminomethyltransferase beta-barrel domain-containing protein, partial [Bacteroidales bacterium]
KTIKMRGFRYITEDLLGDLRSQSANIFFKIRHTPDFTAGKIRFEPFSVKTEKPSISSLEKEDGIWIIESEEPLQGIASGQFGVVYDSNRKLCLGSGIIS